MLLHNNKTKILQLTSIAVIMLLFSINLKAQPVMVKPGGTTYEVELWLKADGFTTLPGDGVAVTSWNDQSGKGRHHLQSGIISTPVYNRSTGLMNYHPSVKFVNVADKLVGPQNFIHEGRSYHVFYVSEVGLSDGTYRTLFTLNVGGNNNNGWYLGKPYFNTSGYGSAYRYFHQGNGKTFGINLVSRPNDATSAQRSYMNGVMNSTPFGARVMTLGTGVSMIGNNRENEYPFIGNVQEIIVLSAAQGNYVTAPEMAKIYSYLSLKYGINYDGGTGNYFNSNGVAIFARNKAGVYHENVFGIARDDKTALYQKQATSYESSFATVFIGNLETLNETNTAVIDNDQTFVLFGSNGEEGHALYDHTNAGYPDMFGGVKVNQRSKEVLKAQITSLNTQLNEYTLKIKPTDTSANYVIVSDDDRFPFDATTIYPLDAASKTAEITIKDGSYIAFVYGYATGPGGLSGNELWMKADDVLGDGTLPGDGTQVITWFDHSGNNRAHNAPGTANTYPFFNRTTNVMNYQPSVKFGGDATNRANRLRGSLFYDANKSYYIFYVSQSLGTYQATDRQTVYDFFSSANTNTTGWFGYTPWFRTGNTTDRRGHTVSTKYAINAVIRPNQTKGLRQQLYTNGKKTAEFDAGQISVGTGYSMIGSADDGTDYSMHGNIQEIIVLSATKNKQLSAMDVARINSYLAIKYGITLEAGDYLSSASSSIWSRTNNIGYEKNIFGIGRDDNSGLYVKQSTSYSDDKLTVYLGTLADLNVNNTASIPDDYTFLILGSNGEEGMTNYPQERNTIFEGGTVIAGKIDYRFKQTYKAQLTGAEQITVNMKVNEPDAEWLFVSSSSEFIPAQTRVYNITDGIAQNVVVKSGDYIMYGFSTEDQAVNYTRRIWLKADDLISLGNGTSVGSWPNAVGGSFTQGTTASQPMVNLTSDLMNYQPSVQFTTPRMNIEGTTLPVAANESYYIFYVSQLQGTDQSNVISLNGTRGNYTGWYNNTPYFTTNSATAGTSGQQSFDGATKKYGITGVIRPNTTTDYQEIYFNGDWQRKPSGTLNTGTGNPIIGSSSGSALPFIGNMQEVIVFSTTDKGRMDKVEAQKINSYLAFKYGLTLELGDYLDENANPFWSRAKAVDSNGKKYEKTIFGVGRNDAMGVYQKQARAYDAPFGSPFAVYVGDALEALNSSNNGTLTNNSFLMLSADQALRSVKPLSKAIPVGTAYMNGVILPTEMNYISATYKAQITGGSSMTVKLHNMVNFNNCYLIVSKNPDFIANETNAFPFDNTTKKLTTPNSEITIEEGDYIAILTVADPAPGGVIDDLRMWMKADEVNTLILSPNGDLQNVLGWKDYSMNGVEYTYMNIDNNNKIPTYETCQTAMNFHPSVFFKKESSSAGAYLSTNRSAMSVAAPDHFTVFTLFNNDFGASNYSYPIGFGNKAADGTDDAQPAFGVQLDGAKKIGRFYDSGGAGAVLTTKNLFTPKSTTIMMDEAKKGGYVRFEFDKYGETVYNNEIGDRWNMNAGGTIGAGSISSRKMHGYMSEIFAYERELDDAEKDAIYSYLGLKYGITIDPAPGDPALNFDYFLSDRTVVWPGTSSETHQPFHNNVAALVRDDAAAFQNSQSRSTKEGNMVWMGLGTEGYGCSGVFPGFDVDKSALVWGHDSIQGIVSFEGNEDICGEMDERMKQVWLVDNSVLKLSDPNDPTSPTEMDSPTVRIRVGGSNYFPYAGPGYQVYMLVADAREDLLPGDETGEGSTHNWKMVIPGTYVRSNDLGTEGDPFTYSGEHEFFFTFDQKYTYFTFAAKKIPGACEPCDFIGEKKLEFSRTNWTNGSTSETIDLGDGFNVTVEANVESPGRFYSRYPRASSQRSLREYRRNGGDMYMTTEITPSVPSAATFEIFEIDYRSRRYDEVEVIGLCESGVISPNLYYKTDAKRSSYEIRGNKAMAKRRTSSYTNNRGKMIVEFEHPVEKIVVRHKITGRTTGSAAKRIGIGPITFTCPLPPPPVNEAGLSFVKQAPQSANLCDVITYTYRIYNSNCSPKEVNFQDILDNGLEFVPNSLSLESDAYTELTIVNDYGSEGKLDIQDLLVAGSSTLTFRIEARFAQSTQPGEYGSFANIDYLYIKEDEEKEGQLASCDRFKGCGFPSLTLVDGDPADRVIPIETTITKSRACYSPSGEITFKISINNPNSTTYSGMTFDLDFNDIGFSLVDEITYDTNVLTRYVEPEETEEPGIYSFVDIDLEPGIHEIVFKIMAPAKNDIEYDDEWVYDDESGKWDLITPDEPDAVLLSLGYEFGIENDDICIENAFAGANGSLDIEMCEGRDAVISNKHITTTIRK